MHFCNPSTQDTEQKDGESEASLSYITNEERREGGTRKIFCCSLLEYMLESSVNNGIMGGEFLWQTRIKTYRWTKKLSHMKQKKKRKAWKSLQFKLNMVTFLGTWQTHNSPGTAVQHNYLQIKGVCLSVCRSNGWFATWPKFKGQKH